MILKTDPEEFQNYLSDASNYSGTADKVFLPESEEEIIELVKEANLNRTRITISGNGTGLNGGRVPEGGVVLSLEKLNKILEMNETEKFVRVQPAVILKDLQDYVEEKKLFYPPDPTERNCFIGATVATNSSGARTFKYGPTRDYVLAIRVVLPNGEIVYLERGKQNVENYSAKLLTEQGSEINISVPQFEMPNTKNASGYYCKQNMDLIDLFIGSEGTLGIITELELALIKKPENIMSLLAFFNTENDAFNFFFSAVKELKTAVVFEYFDNGAFELLRPKIAELPKDKNFAVFFETEITDNSINDISSIIEKLLNKNNSSM